MVVLQARERLQLAPEVMREMRKFWFLVMAQKGRGEVVIDREEYVEFFFLCGQALMQEEAVTREDIAEEWERDSKGAGVMDVTCFYASLFELVGADVRIHSARSPLACASSLCLHDHP